MNRSMTMNGLAQPGSTLADDYGAVGSVIRMRPGGHIDPSQAYGAPPAPEPEPEPEAAVKPVPALPLIALFALVALVATMGSRRRA